MSPPIINVRTADDPRDAIHRAVQALAEGKLIAVPTETVYGIAASALHAKAVQRLSLLKERKTDRPFTLAIKSADEALDFAPGISSLAHRLARRCWPGPVTLVLDDDHHDSLLQQLPEEVRKAVSHQGTVGLRVPAHEVILQVLRLSAGPLVLTSANRAGEPEAVTAKEVVEKLGDAVDLVLDDGQSKFGQPSSVVHVSKSGLKLLRSGVINDQALKRLSSFIIVLVCTGNTCRSPMAESLMKARVAKRLQCPPTELEDRGIIVASAGIAAMAGGRASSESVQAMQERGCDLSAHESQPLSDRLVRFADLILTMTRGHREAILAQWPSAADRIHLLSRDGNDIADPIGGPLDLYRRCADQLDAQLEAWMSEIDFDSLPDSGQPPS